jgi:NTP pyrophosphatase (non-canonical NTP hydrolase)
MTLDEYQRLAASTAIYGHENNVTYPALGLAGEAGEVANKVKKLIRDHGGVSNLTSEQRYAIADECGDVLWYVAALLRDLDVNLDVVAQRNIDKLRSRAERGTLGGNGDKR